MCDAHEYVMISGTYSTLNIPSRITCLDVIRPATVNYRSYYPQITLVALRLCQARAQHSKTLVPLYGSIGRTSPGRTPRDILSNWGSRTSRTGAPPCIAAEQFLQPPFSIFFNSCPGIVCFLLHMKGIVYAAMSNRRI